MFKIRLLLHAHARPRQPPYMKRTIVIQVFMGRERETYMRAKQTPLFTNESMEALDSTHGAVNGEVGDNAPNAQRLKSGHTCENFE